MSKARQLADLGNVYDDGALSNRNLIINGACVVDQRANGSFTLGTSSTFIVDQWRALRTGSSTMTAEKSTDAPDGFTNSCKVSVTTGASVAAGDYTQFSTRVEGYNTAFLDFGSSAAKTITISFYVKSSLTGDFGFALMNQLTDKNYNTSYTINAANTWERKTITIEGATDGTWQTDNQVGFALYWDLGIGSTYSTSTTDQWITAFEFGLSGGTKLSANTGATWQITGIQLEVGESATPFEHRSYGDELARCQRYYYRTQSTRGNGYGAIFTGVIYSTGTLYGSFNLPQEMRASPTTGNSGATGWRLLGNTAPNCGAPYVGDSTPREVLLGVVSTGQTGGTSWSLTPTSTNSWLAFDAEL